MPLDRVDRETYTRQGYVVARGLVSRKESAELVAYADGLLLEDGAGRIQRQFGRTGEAQLVKINQLTEKDPVFSTLARRPEIVDIVEMLVGPGARIFRDVLIVKPAGTAGTVSYHQDSAYWDVEPPALLSCWLALTDADTDSSCLRVIPGSHERRREHGLVLRGRTLPRPLVSALRALVSYAGTGDNPGGAGGNKLLWALKRFVLAGATSRLPSLGELQDYRTLPHEVDLAVEQVLPVQAGDAIFFHSLLLHGSGPNRSPHARLSPIISYMPAEARFVGKGNASFPIARAPVAG